MPIYPKKSTYREKLRYFKITFKNRFFAHMYIQKYQHVEKKEFFWDYLEKHFYCPYLRKYEHFGENFLIKILNIKFLIKYTKLYFHISIVGHISVKINLLPKTTFFEIILKKTFYCTYLRKYQHFVVNHVFGDHFEKNRFFVHISVNTNISKKGSF